MKTLITTFFLLLGAASAHDTVEPTTIEPTTPVPTTLAPTTMTPCMDSTRKFFVNERLRSCHWVAAANTEEKCKKSKGAVATHCPATCGTCDVCTDATKPFMTAEKGKHDCKWVAKRGNKKGYPQRCNDIGDESTCRLTCGQCATTDAPLCQDSPQKFYVDEVLRTCAWVAGAPETKCKKGKSETHCPLTCGKCLDGFPKNSGATFVAEGLVGTGKPVMKTCLYVKNSTTKRCKLISADDCGHSTCPEDCPGC